MKKKVLAVLLTGAMAMSMLTACGGGSKETAETAEKTETVEGTAETTAETTDAAADADMCSDDTFEELQDNYSVLSETYATVEKAYQSGDIEQSAEVEENLSTIASMIELFGEMTQDNVTEEEAVEFNEGMLEIIDVLQKIVDEM